MVQGLKIHTTHTFTARSLKLGAEKVEKFNVWSSFRPRLFDSLFSRVPALKCRIVYYMGCLAGSLILHYRYSFYVANNLELGER